MNRSWWSEVAGFLVCGLVCILCSILAAFAAALVFLGTYRAYLLIYGE